MSDFGGRPIDIAIVVRSVVPRHTRNPPAFIVLSIATTSPPGHAATSLISCVSGESGLAFATDEDGSVPNSELNGYFAAAYEAAHEAVLNCLVAARPAERLDGTMQDAFPLD